MTISLIILGILLALAGFAGCILPIIPGPPLSYLALIALSLAKDWEPFSITFLIVMATLAVIVMILDYLVPVLGAAKAGASKTGIYLSIAGMILGIFLFPPWGIFIGAFAGGIAGEILAGRKGKEAIKVGWAIFVGNMLSVGIKLSFALVVIFFYLKELF
ncbi:DUF456 domain-containing protein [Deltaproteobacteria bacterium]|nr:DUF456 domain-containing protein [Deltaproteobacteria bacterium]